jgi:flagellar basal body-associated protein FliL
MWILMLEAIVALFLLVFIVWWTMFSGRDAAPRERAKPPVPKENDTPEP